MVETVKFLSSRFLSASTLVGAHVRNPQDESLGDLKDFMIDATSGKIAFGVVTYSAGFLGMGHKLFAIPWSNFRVDADREHLLLDVPKERLKDAPGFDENHWPNFDDPHFADEVGRHYTAEPVSRVPPAPPVRDHNIIHPE